MRLICPNCGAQYEVDASLIPIAGRDVQCSNCGHAWFQKPAHLDAGLSEELGLAPEKPAAPPPPHAVPEAAPAAMAAAMPPAAAAAPPPVRPALDPEVRSILVEEGAREAKARRGDDSIETQGDLGLAEGEPRGTTARDRIARLRSLDAEERAEGAAAAIAAATAAGSRRDLLPDIEEINSSLRPLDERGSGIVPDDIAAPERRSGFGVGFMLVVLAAVMGLGVYVFADRLSALIPGSEGVLTAYVGWVDMIRDGLERLAQDWVARLSKMVESVREAPAS